MNKKLVLTIAFVLVIVAGLVFYGVNRSDNDTADSSQQSQQNGQSNSDQPDASGEVVTKRGTFGCLQPKGDGPHTMECAFGLTTDDGTVYALRADDPTIFGAASGGTGQKIEVTGTLSAPQQTTKFDTAGTIHATSVKAL